MLNANNALLFKRFQRGRNRSIFSRKFCNAQIALLECLQHELLLNGTLARLEFICPRSARHPTLVDLGNHRSRHLPGAVDTLHTRHAARWHKQAYARRKRCKVTIRQELRTLGANLSKARFAQHFFYGFELRKIKGRWEHPRSNQPRSPRLYAPQREPAPRNQPERTSTMKERRD